jgi:hypothetical protein
MSRHPRASDMFRCPIPGLSWFTGCHVEGTAEDIMGSIDISTGLITLL